MKTLQIIKFLNVNPVELSPVSDSIEQTSINRSTPEQSPQAQFVEDVGIMFEAVGLPRMAGRILGWLLVSVPAQQSLSEITEVLQASKGSISMMTRLLIQVGLIERVSLPGDRRDYFQIKPNAWTQMSQQRMTQITAFRELADRGLALLADQESHQQLRLQEMRDIHAFWERELPLLHDRWIREQTSDSK